jgi:signal transduction histidine kinase/CheY-like chemotaxis protein
MAAKNAMMVDPQIALDKATESLKSAFAFGPGVNRAVTIATAQWLQGEALVRLNQVDRARPIIEAAMRTIAANQPGSKLHGDLTMVHGLVEAVDGRVQPALRDFQTAHEIFRAAGQPRSQAIALQNIGSIYLDARDYPRVLSYYAQSSEAFDADLSLTLASHHNRAVALRLMGRPLEAETQARLAFNAAQKLGGGVLATRILSNLASAQIASGKLDAASLTISRAQRIAAREPAAAEWKPLLLGAAAEIAEKRGRLDEAGKLFEQTFSGRDLRNTKPLYLEIHQAAADTYARLGDNRLALEHLRAYKRLDDEARTLAASTNAMLMAARFDFANQDLKIAKLRAGQLERDIQLAKTRERFRSTVTMGLLGAGGVVMALLAFGYITTRRSRNEIRAANLNLSDANSKLETALEAKTQFLATTSHEIRTPLNGILGMTQVILAGRDVDAGLREKIELVHGAGETMRALVDDILDAAKMETGHLAIHPVETDLHRMLGEVAKLWKGQADSKGLDLDESRLRQIISNLMANALKFTDAGNVVLEGVAEQRPEGERLILRLTDSGTGIPTEQLESIFESFRQVDGGTTRKHGGTGLGLAICRNLARAMGGDVTVSSELGVGSTFILDLPLTRSTNIQSLAERPRSESGQPKILKDCAMLLIEANPLTQSIMRAVLQPQVRSLDLAGGIDPALHALESGRYDHILAEGATLAGGEGDSLAALRSIIAAGRGARVTVLWPNTNPEDHAAILQSGVDQLLVKPISTGDLVTALCNMWPEHAPAEDFIRDEASHHRAAAE